MTDTSAEFYIRQIEPGDNVAGLSLGEAIYTPLKTFLKKNAKVYHEQLLAKTYCAFLNKNKLIGYISLVCGEIATYNDEYEILRQDQVNYSYEHCPAMKIARLAVDKRYRKTGVGSVLVDMALGIAKDEISKFVGCRFVVVDSKKIQ